jgi:hypothetical protein
VNDDLLTRNSRLAEHLPAQQSALAENARGRIAPSQRYLMRNFVVQYAGALGLMAVMLQTPVFVLPPVSSPTLNVISLVLLGLGLTVVVLYVRMPHSLASVRQMQGVIHLHVIEGAQSGDIDLVDPAQDRRKLTFRGASQESLRAFVEGAGYRIYYLHLPGSGDCFLSAVAI